MYFYVLSDDHNQPVVVAVAYAAALLDAVHGWGEGVEHDGVAAVDNQGDIAAGGEDIP